MNGMNLIPVRTENKKAAIQWHDYKLRQSTQEERDEWKGKGLRFGTVCGQISGNLEVIDFDWDAVTTKHEWKERLKELYGLDVDTLGCPVVKTVKGYHYYYRCKTIGAADLLASRSSDGKTLIETRGEGSYVVSPIDDVCEEYSLVEGSFDEIPEISPDTRDTLLACARSFDQVEPQVVYVKKEKPGEDYNEKITWEEILPNDGWTKLRERMDGVTEWTRPGKTEGISATTGVHDLDILYVFTSSMAPLQAGKGYSKFGYYTTVAHNGDASAAAKKLASEGYGQTEQKEDGQWVQMARLVEECDLVQDDKGEGFLVTDTGVVPCQSLASKNYFLEKYKEVTGYTPTRLVLLQQAVDYASVVSMSGESYHMQPRMMHADDGATYLDLCQPDNRDYMKVDGNNITRVSAPEGVYLSRNSGQKSMNMPDLNHAEIDTLRRYLNVEDEVSWELVKLWLLGSTCPTGAKPILLLHGNADSGKTTFTTILKEILDPCDPPVLTYPKGQEDIRIHCSSHNVIPYDNLSGITNSLSDALSTLSTGIGYQVRKLYTDSDVYFIKAKRSIILNGIDPVARRGDFASRAINVKLANKFVKRLTDEEIEDGVLTYVDRWRGWIWKNHLIGRRLVPKTILPDDSPFRLADMTKFLLAAERGLGLKHKVQDLLTVNKASLDSELREADSVSLLVMEYMADKAKVSGRASVLFDLVAEWGGRRIQRIKDWPDSPVGFGIRLSRSSDYLAAVGIIVSKQRKKEGMEYIIENISVS